MRVERRGRRRADDPRDRLRDIGDAWALVAQGDRARPPAPSPWRLAWAIAAALALLAG